MLVTGMAVCVNTITEMLVCSHPFSGVSDGMLRAFVNHHCSKWICSSFPAAYFDITAGMRKIKYTVKNPPPSSSSPDEGQMFE